MSPNIFNQEKNIRLRLDLQKEEEYGIIDS